MQCPSCKEINKDKVIDSRLSEGGKAIRRRRECGACGKRYTTKERVEQEAKLTVIKKDGSRVPFDIERLLKGMGHACYKRPISQDVLQKEAESIEDELAKGFEREVPSGKIGLMVCKRLRELDHVAYLRFSSIYHDFKNLDDMIDEIAFVKDMTAESAPGQQSLFDAGS